MSERVERPKLLDTWIAEWSGATYVGADWAWIQRIELAKECVRLRRDLAATLAELEAWHAWDVAREEDKYSAAKYVNECRTATEALLHPEPDVETKRRLT